MSWIITNLWLIPAIPIAISLGILSFAKSRRKSAAGLAVIGQVIALALSIVAFWRDAADAWLSRRSEFHLVHFRRPSAAHWLGSRSARRRDARDDHASSGSGFLSSASATWPTTKISPVSSPISRFSPRAMLGVVIANSLLLLFVCWELVGLASYLLIGFWIQQPSAAAAAKKAFITTRIGDIGFFLGMLWLYRGSGTLLFYDDGNGCLESAGLALLGASATFIALLIFCGAVGKSGQFPLHVWLPDAMEGPTPGQRADPRRHHGRGRRVSGRARLSALFV